MKKIVIFTGLLFVVLICFFLFRPITPIGLPDDIPGKFISVNSQNIRYVDAGSGLPLVFIHGFGASIFSWRKNLEPLSEYHRVCAPDLPGFGYSDKPLDADYSIDAYADFMIQFMDRLKIEKAVLVGHSLGGGIALLTSLKYPARVLALVLLDAEAYPITPPLMLKIAKLPGVRSVVHRAIGEWVVRVSLQRSFHDPSFITEPLIEEYYRPFLTENGKAAPIRVLQAMDFEKLQELPERYRNITKKTLIIWGREDQISGIHLARKLKKDLPNSRLRIIPECGHLVQEEKPEEVNRAIIRFAKRIRR
ncbi:MAG: alpha/beta fold hydrolase [Desulfobacterales bacterium]|nr:alpha/beta fold hydrolase [Desulfobacterales bacterium]